MTKLIYVLAALVGVHASATLLAQTIRLGDAEGYVIAELASTENATTIKTDRTYYWVRTQRVFATQGGVSGTLLHGLYTAYFPDGQLRERGEFRSGLKDGEWSAWYSSGRLRSIERWNKGLLQGTALRYDPDGQLLDKIRYRRGVARKTKSKPAWLRRMLQQKELSSGVEQGDADPAMTKIEEDQRPRKKTKDASKDEHEKPGKQKRERKSRRAPSGKEPKTK